VPVAVASADHDGFGTGSELVRARSPAARPITLVAAGQPRPLTKGQEVGIRLLAPQSHESPA